MSDHTDQLPVVALISGGGTNLQALIDAAGRKKSYRIVAVISNRPEAYGLKRAEEAGIPAIVVDHQDYTDRGRFDQTLIQTIDTHRPGLVVMAGFMRILTPGFVHHYEGRLINIHPSLLPRHRGLHTHQRVINDRDNEHGASVHFVTEELDGGPVILQARVPVRSDDTAEKLAARVLTREHIIYPMVVDWYARGLLAMRDNRVIHHGHPLEAPLIYPDDTDET